MGVHPLSCALYPRGSCSFHALSGVLFAPYPTSTLFAKDLPTYLARQLRYSQLAIVFLCLLRTSGFSGRILRLFFTLARHIHKGPQLLTRLPKCEETCSSENGMGLFAVSYPSPYLRRSKCHVTPRFSRTCTVFQRHAVSTCCTCYCVNAPLSN